jgi:hypothetical protein
MSSADLGLPFLQRKFDREKANFTPENLPPTSLTKNKFSTQQDATKH